MTWPSKDPADYQRSRRRLHPGLVATLLVLALVATLVLNAVVAGDLTVAPALTVVLGAVLLLRLLHVRSSARRRSR